MTWILGLTVLLTAVIVALVIVADRLDGKGRHKLQASRSHRADRAGLAADRFVGELRGHLGGAGCLPLDPEPLGWDFDAQLPGAPDDPCDTGEFGALLGRGRWTGKQEADRLAGKYLTAPEVTR